MAIFESLVNVLKALAVGDRIKVTLTAGNWTPPKSCGRASHAKGCFRKFIVRVGTRPDPD
jgi:hypothetical protein